MGGMTDEQLKRRTAERRRVSVPQHHDRIRQILSDEPASEIEDSSERGAILDELVRWKLDEAGLPDGQRRTTITDCLWQALDQWLEYGHRTIGRLIDEGHDVQAIDDACGAGRADVVRATFAGFPPVDSREYLEALVQREAAEVNRKAQAEGRTVVVGETRFDANSMTCQTYVGRIRPDTVYAWKRQARTAKHTVELKLEAEADDA